MSRWHPSHARQETLQAADAYSAIAEGAGLTPSQLAILWCRTRPFIATHGAVIICGTSPPLAAASTHSVGGEQAPSSSGARRSRSWRRTSRRSRCRRRRSPRRWSARSTRCTCDAATRATASEHNGPDRDPRPDARAHYEAALVTHLVLLFLSYFLYAPSDARVITPLLHMSSGERPSRGVGRLPSCRPAPLGWIRDQRGLGTAPWSVKAS